jgi:hypothetical protein
MNRTGRNRTRTHLHFVTDLPLEADGNADRSEPNPETRAGAEPREWFWCQRVMRLRMDELSDGTEEIATELEYFEQVPGGSSSTFSDQTDADANPGAR